MDGKPFQPHGCSCNRPYGRPVMRVTVVLSVARAQTRGVVLGFGVWRGLLLQQEAMTSASRVHPACVNAGNPYHECSEYCFRRIAEGQLAERATDASLAGVFFLSSLSSSGLGLCFAAGYLELLVILALLPSYLSRLGAYISVLVCFRVPRVVVRYFVSLFCSLTSTWELHRKLASTRTSL